MARAATAAEERLEAISSGAGDGWQPKDVSLNPLACSEEGDEGEQGRGGGTATV